jgi:uncharacterized membrane protein YfcA
MAFGSFVAGATPGGGGAFAFPVLTKWLSIAPSDARTFGLLIQAVGMTMAAVVIVTRRMAFLRPVVVWATAGGVVGMTIGTCWVAAPSPYPKVLFTVIAAVFGASLIICRLWLRLPPRDGIAWGPAERWVFAFSGLLGGFFASQIGTGIDLLTFVVLTLAYGVDEKASTFTSVIIMAINSVVGSVLHVVVIRDVGVCWDYWLVAVPIVVVGAPLGSLVAWRLQREFIVVFLLALIALEVVTTALLVTVSTSEALLLLTVAAGCALCFWRMVRFRQQGRVVVAPARYAASTRARHR